MVYDWAPYKDECYDLYVNQRKSLVQVADYLRTRYGFNPKPRTFQHKFKAWGFPPKKDPSWKSEEVVARVKELWSRNLTAQEMLRILNEEDGYDIDSRILQRIRSTNGLLLRTSGAAFGLTSAGQRVEKLKQATKLTSAAERQRSRETTGGSNVDDDEGSSEDEEEYEEEYEHVGGVHGQGVEDANLPVVEPVLEQPISELTPEQEAAAEARKQQRLMELQAESMARWATKKRRRRTMPFAGLPADPPCPPRFPSETTLTETKAILGLDEEAYHSVRKIFWDLCEQAGVIKKTLAGPDRWEALKDQLVRQSIHLRASMWDQTDLERKKLAIDIICCDVTKRMRVVGNQLTVAKSKVILNLDPEQGRQIRSALYLLLAQEKFESKHFEGKAHWKELKAKWYESSDLMRRLSVYERPDCPDPDRALKLRAVEFLARDATRRYREEAVKQGRNVLDEASKPPAARKKKEKSVPQSDPTLPSGHLAPPPPASHAPQPHRGRARKEAAHKEPAPPKQPGKRGPGRPPGTGKAQKARAEADSRTSARLAPIQTLVEAPEPEPQHIDPLITATAGHDYTFAGQTHRFRVTGPGYGGSSASQTVTQPAPPTATPAYHAPVAQQQQPVQTQAHQSAPSMAVFFKLHAGSALPTHLSGPSMWISTIAQQPTVEDVRAAALDKYPGAMCFAIEGIVKDGKGGELPLPVSDDMELDAYLSHVQGNANVTGHSAAPTFVVQLMA